MTKYQITGIGEYQWILVLNPMMSNTESGQEFGPFNTREELLAFYNSFKVEPYVDEGPDMFGHLEVKKYHKTFSKGSPLEWMNPLRDDELEQPGYHGHGIYEVLVNVEQVIKNHPIF